MRRSYDSKNWGGVRVGSGRKAQVGESDNAPMVKVSAYLPQEYAAFLLTAFGGYTAGIKKLVEMAMATGEGEGHFQTKASASELLELESKIENLRLELKSVLVLSEQLGIYTTEKDKSSKE